MSREVDEAVGEAPEREPTVFEKLEQKRAELAQAKQDLAQANRDFDADAVLRAQQKIVVLEGFIDVLEVDADLLNEDMAQQDAKKRMLAIRKAVGSIASEFSEDEAIIRSLHAQLVERIQRTNKRYLDIERLSIEAAALTDRFKLAEKPVQVVTPPAIRMSDLKPLPVILDTQQPVKPGIQNHPDLTTWFRRTYSEIEGTPGKEIIDRVGFKPWPALTPQQQAQLDNAKERKKREEAAVDALPPIPPQGDYPLANHI